MKLKQTTKHTPIFTSIQQEVLAPIAQGQPITTETVVLTRLQRRCLEEELNREINGELTLTLRHNDGKEDQVTVTVEEVE